MFLKNLLILGNLTVLLTIPLFCPPCGYTQEMTKEQMMQKIIELEKRIEELELDKKTSTTGTTQPAPQQPATPAPASPKTASPKTASPKTASPKATSVPGNVYWNNGLRIDIGDEVKLSLGGRIQNDWFVPLDDEDVDPTNTQEWGTEFRRARLYIAGDLYDQYEFKAQYDFAGGNASFNDVYLGMFNLPVVGGIRAGHFKEPFSLEELTSARFITFMERALPNELVPARNTGVMLHNSILDDRFNWAVGGFKESDSQGVDVGEGNAVTGRVSGTPWFDDKSHLFHLGAAASYRETDDNNNDGINDLRYRERPELGLASRIIDTGFIPVDEHYLLGAEAALVYGPLSIQGEFIFNDTDTPAGLDPSFDGWYVFGSYFLTGESRAYSKPRGVFSRVSPGNPFFLGTDGIGAWEIALRYSQLNLDDSGLTATTRGELDDITAALNWYPTANTRLMLNYVFADINTLALDDTEHLFGARLQVDF